MLLGVDSILSELAYKEKEYPDISEYLEYVDYYLEELDIIDRDYDKIFDRFKLDILDIEDYVKKNQWKVVSDPRPFSTEGNPSRNGLLSNEIFGYTMEERSGTFGYIDLHGMFMDPSCYKTWIRLDSRIKNIVHGIDYYSLDSKGNLVKDDDKGKTGIDFLYKNIDKIKFKESSATSKSISIKYLEMNRKKMFISKYIVIPPFYRDKNTSQGARKVIGLGGINKLYNNLIVSANALIANQDYGFDASDEMKGRVQEIILNIYDWFCGNRNPALSADSGQGLSGKLGVLRMSGMSKTSNFSSRLVISPSELKVERPEDLLASFDKAQVPLYSVITEFRDFIMYQVRLFFENEFNAKEYIPIIDKNGKVSQIIVKDPLVEFSDERIKKEMDRFLHGYNNRFVPVIVTSALDNKEYYLFFKGRYQGMDETNKIQDELKRPLTWCDVFYIAAIEATFDKHVLITRFPIDYFSNQITLKVHVSSTKETEENDIIIDDVVYQHYPKIRAEDIGKDTSNSFIDTLIFNNIYLDGMDGDYDGDQCTCKGVYTREANDELEKFIYSKQNLVSLGGGALKEVGADAIQSLYALTKILSTVKVTSTSDIKYS